jgi:hypothetical protein
MKSTCSENEYRKNVAHAWRCATTTELQYDIRLMESMASWETLREAKCRMLQAERDLVCAIGGDPNATLQNSKDEQDESHSS